MNSEEMMKMGKWVVFGALGFLLIMMMVTPKQMAHITEVPYSQFIGMVKSKSVAKMIVADDLAIFSTVDGQKAKVIIPKNDQGLWGDLLNNDVDVIVKEKEQPSIFWSWFPTLLLIGVIVWVFSSQKKAMSRQMGQMDDKSKSIDGEKVNVTFADVAGVDEAKHDLQETIEFLKNPAKFTKLGAKPPCGALMEGPPGTGKTLLAKACAGEAGVPFFAMAGSDFVEKFVGVGANRVRSLFEKARAAAPCIIFIDEIDAIGKQRGNGVMSNDERDQTLNSLLVEMDGFDGTEGIVILAATNRSEILDKALTRPGRFDRLVNVGLPDIKGREAILKVHAKKIIVDESLDWRTIAKGCVGMSGADLANLVNEAALVATRLKHDAVDASHVEIAKDKIMMGAERTTFVMSDEEKKLTAYHEAGHAIVGLSVPQHDPVHKVSIVPRGRALGVTMYLPEDDRVSYSRVRLESQLRSLMGGRAAEEIIFGEDAITTGASNDIERATGLARKMVEEWGYSDLGPLNWAKDQNSYTDDRSPEMLAKIDERVTLFVEEAYLDAKNILSEKLDELHTMSNLLLEEETIERHQVEAIMGIE